MKLSRRGLLQTLAGVTVAAPAVDGQVVDVDQPVASPPKVLGYRGHFRHVSDAWREGPVEIAVRSFTVSPFGTRATPTSIEYRETMPGHDQHLVLTVLDWPGESEEPHPLHYPPWSPPGYPPPLMAVTLAHHLYGGIRWTTTGRLQAIAYHGEASAVSTFTLRLRLEAQLEESRGILDAKAALTWLA